MENISHQVRFLSAVLELSSHASSSYALSHCEVLAVLCREVCPTAIIICAPPPTYCIPGIGSMARSYARSKNL